MGKQNSIDASNQFNSFIKGWKHAVGTKPTDPIFTGHENPLIKQAYEDGYARGYSDKGKVANEAAEKYGYVISYLRLAED